MLNSHPDNSIADKLISAHDGDVALLYIWLCRNGGFDADNAARDLCKTSHEIECAYEKLSRLKLSSEPVKVKTPLTAESEVPEYKAEDIIQLAKYDDGVKAVMDQAEEIYGRPLSTTEMRALTALYNHNGIPPEVFCQLLTYCKDLFAAKYGPGRLPTMRCIEKEANIWVNREILTFEQAEEYIANAEYRRSAIGQVQEALNIRGRSLTATESRYVNEWLDMGFDADALAIAYDRTVTNTGALKWGYMNKIVHSWHEKKLHSAKEIEEMDSRSPASAGSGRNSEVDLDYLRAVYEKVKNTNK